MDAGHWIALTVGIGFPTFVVAVRWAIRHALRDVATQVAQINTAVNHRESDDRPLVTVVDDLDSKIDRLSGRVDAGFEMVDGRLVKVEKLARANRDHLARLDRHNATQDARLDSDDAELEEHDGRIERLEGDGSP